MSKIFKNTLKSFKSDITGEEKEYTVNNAVWGQLDDLFNMTQEDFDKEIQKGSNRAMAKFATAVMNANGMNVSEKEVLENTDPKAVIKFYNDFYDTAFGVDDDLKKKEEQAEENRQKLSSK